MKNLANKITITRVAAVPVFALFYFYGDKGQKFFWIAWAIYLYCGITDVLDGYIARRFKQITDFGKFLDPLADKLLNISAFVISIKFGLPKYLALCVFLRDFLLFLSYSYLKLRIEHVTIRPSRLGRSVAIAQFLLINAILLNMAVGNLNLYKELWFEIVSYGFVALLLVSFFQYMIHGLRQFYQKASDIKVHLPGFVQKLLKLHTESK